MLLNPEFIANIHDIYGENGKQWLQQLPKIIQQLAEEWQFEFQNPLPKLSYHFVGLVISRQHGQAVLKIAPRQTLLTNEIAWLKLHYPLTPEIYAQQDCAFLMEYLQPGHSLKELVISNQDDAATKIICQLICELQPSKEAPQIYPHLQSQRKYIPYLEKHLSGKLYSKVNDLFYTLTQETKRDVVIHGDLHHYNILSDRKRWRVIDPHGYLGDAVAEVGAMICNPCWDLAEAIHLEKFLRKRIEILTAELPFAAQHIKAWLLCRTALAAAWTCEAYPKPSDFELASIYELEKYVS